jgi:hypothetical protein
MGGAVAGGVVAALLVVAAAAVIVRRQRRRLDEAGGALRLKGRGGDPSDGVEEPSGHAHSAVVSPRAAARFGAEVAGGRIGTSLPCLPGK